MSQATSRVEVTRVDGHHRGRRACRRRTPSRPADAGSRPPALIGEPEPRVALVAASRGSTSLPGAVDVLLSDLDQVIRQRDRRDRDLDRVTARRDLDLDRRVQRERRHADGGPCVHAGVAEDGAEQLGGAVGDLRLGGEVGRRRDEDDDLHDALDQRQVADLGVDRRDRVEGALLCAGVGLLLGHLGADLAGGHQLARAHRELAGGEDLVAAAHRRDVDRDRRGDLGDGEAELGQPLSGVLMRRAGA